MEYEVREHQRRALLGWRATDGDRKGEPQAWVWQHVGTSGASVPCAFLPQSSSLQAPDERADGNSCADGKNEMPLSTELPKNAGSVFPRPTEEAASTPLTTTRSRWTLPVSETDGWCVSVDGSTDVNGWRYATEWSVNVVDTFLFAT